MNLRRPSNFESNPFGEKPSLSFRQIQYSTCLRTSYRDDRQTVKEFSPSGNMGLRTAAADLFLDLGSTENLGRSLQHFLQLLVRERGKGPGRSKKQGREEPCHHPWVAWDGPRVGLGSWASYFCHCHRPVTHSGGETSRPGTLPRIRGGRSSRGHSRGPRTGLCRRRPPAPPSLLPLPCLASAASGQELMEPSWRLCFHTSPLGLPGRPCEELLLVGVSTWGWVCAWHVTQPVPPKEV